MAKSVLRPLGSVIALTILAFALPASAQTIALRWIPSASSGVTGYRVYVGPVQEGPIVSTPINVGSPTPDASGVSSATITLDRTRAWVAELTAYSSTGAESPRSNRVTIPSFGESLGTPVHRAYFDDVAIGTQPPGYLGPAGAFQVVEFSGANRVLSTRTLSSRIVARYIGPEMNSVSSYELSGRTSLSYLTQAGVAVRVPYSTFSEYYALGVDSRRVFALSQAGKAPLRCASSASTGVSVMYSVWYRFKLRVTNPSGRGRVRAKVWRQTETEPSAWQADCWTDTAVTLGSGAFAVYREAGGTTYWDDIEVRPVIGTLDPIP